MKNQYYYIDKYGYIISELNGKVLSMYKEDDYSGFKQCENLEELCIKLMRNYKYITEDMELSKSEIRNRLNKSLVDEFESFIVSEDHVLGTILDYYINYHKIHNFFFLLQSKINDPELEKSFLKIEIGDFMALKTLKFSRDMNDVQKYCVENSFLKKYFHKITWKQEFKDNNFQISQALFFKYLIEDTYNKLRDTDLFMKEILKTEADRYIIDLTINSVTSKEIVGKERKKLFPNIFSLDIKTVDQLAYVDSVEDMNLILHSKFKFEKDVYNELIKREILKYLESFNVFNDVSCIYAYFKLKEQEIKNILWIVECISQNRKEEADNLFLIN